MSESRKDVRAKLDANLHRALKIFAKADGLTEAEFIESVLVPHLHRRVHGTITDAAELTLAGITGNRRDNPGETGTGSASPDSKARR